MDFEFKRRSKICSKTERELGPGEKYFSILFEQDGEVVRSEIAAGAWDGPPENCISWWQARIPERDPNKFFWAPNDVILDYFESFIEDEERQVEQFMLALLLIQKRIFRLTDSETDEDGVERIYVSCARRNSKYEVTVCHPESDEAESIQDELVELLFSDEPFEELDEETELDPDMEMEDEIENDIEDETETDNSDQGLEATQ